MAERKHHQHELNLLSVLITHKIQIYVTITEPTVQTPWESRHLGGAQTTRPHIIIEIIDRISGIGER